MNIRAILLAAAFLLPGHVFAAAGEWLWTGGVTDREALTVFGASRPGHVTLRTGTEGPAIAPTAITTPAEGIHHVRWSGLQPSTAYEILSDGEASGKFRTLPVPGQPASFQLAVASCNQNPDSRVFEAIGALDPEMMIITGDFHYSDIGRNVTELFVRALTANLKAPIQGAFWRKTPVTYVWDDHDFGPDNSDSTSPSREASLEAYNLIVPHYPFAVEGPGAGIAQSFTWGRVHFVVTDLRSERLRGKRMMSGAQSAWLKSELSRAGREFPLVVWVSSVPWNGTDTKADRWSGYPDERREIADFIKANGLAGRIVILSGDAHMCAIDDGANSDFADGGGAPVPVFQAAALERSGSYKGGPYNRGARPGTNQFGWMEVRDSGGELEILWSGRDGRDPTGKTVLTATRDAEGPIEYRFTVPALPSEAKAKR